MFDFKVWRGCHLALYIESFLSLALAGSKEDVLSRRATDQHVQIYQSIRGILWLSN